MKEPDRPYESFLDIRNIIPWITVIFFLGFLVLAIVTYRSFVISLFISAIFYILFLKPFHYISNKLGNRKTLASILAIILTILIIIIPVIFIVINLIEELTIAISIIKKYLNHFDPETLKNNEIIAKIIETFGITNTELKEIQVAIVKSAQETGISFLKDLRFLFSDFMRFIMNFIISIFLLFLFFRKGDEIAMMLYDNFPFPEGLKSQIVSRMVSVFNAVVKGNILIAFAQGLIIGLLFWIFNLSTPILYGVLGTFFGLIPVIGTNILWMPAALYLYSNGNTTEAFIFGSIAFSAYLLLENLAKPLLMDKELKLHPLLLLLSLLGGLTEFGIKGLIIGPFSITIFLTLWQLIKVWNINHGNIKE
ncbi:MAG: AI-2E family transporter [Spirochaetia bacterium]|nr:AI-2E family transporter [Spirochaetia bacterium]